MEIKEKDLQSVINWFKYLYSIGADEVGAVTRLGYTKVEDVMHGAIRNLAREMGLKYTSDEVGNTFIYEKDYEEYHLIGSHLDSVVNGGRYDGVVGVISGLLILKWIKEEKLNIPLKVAAFRCEESSVFGLSTVGSSLITKKLDVEKMKIAKNKEGVSLYKTLKDRGFNPNCKKIQGVLSYLELHIEQGRILEELGLKIGIIDAIAAPTRYWLTIEGQQDHSGATPMNYRKDALCAGAEIILELEKIANMERENHTVGTVGYLENYPNAFNVVPGKIRMGLDIRGVEWESIQKIKKEIVEYIELICKKRNLKYELNLISEEEPVKLDENLRDDLEKISDRLGIKYIRMNSGAGHDAMKFWNIAPTGMVFIPCKEGISHNKEEEIDFSDVVLGSYILFEKLKNDLKN